MHAAGTEDTSAKPIVLQHSVVYCPRKHTVVQMNEQFLEFKRDIYIGIVEKVQAKCSDTNKHRRVCMCRNYTVEPVSAIC